MATAQALVNKFNKLKTLPHVGIRLTKLITDENSTMEEFEEIIRLDPTLVLRLLSMVNSSYYALRQKISSISRAVVFIGMKNLRNMVVTEALKTVFKSSVDGDGFSRSHLWLHSAAVSICSQMISERIFEQKGEDAFLCGILHDIGMIVEDQVAQDLFVQTCKACKKKSRSIVECEQEIVGTDHCETGYVLACDWKLPFEAQEGIRNHHKALRTVSPSSITGIIQIADYIASKMNYTAMPGMDGALLSPPLADHIRDNLAEYKALARDIPGEMAKAREIYELKEE
jgi:HD-like signal output (HDOD) protein